MIPHVNIGGYAGVGKTTVALILAEWYRTLWIPRVTTRPMRRGENLNEYEFVSEEEFKWRLQPGDKGVDVIITDRPDDVIIPDTPGTGTLFSQRKEAHLSFGHSVGRFFFPSVHQIRLSKEEYYYTGVPHPIAWPQPLYDTELVLSTFGYSSPQIKEYAAPEMITVFINVSDRKELRNRLYERCRRKRQVFTPMWDKNLAQMERHREREHQHVVYNDGTPEKCAAEIARIARLRLAA